MAGRVITTALLFVLLTVSTEKSVLAADEAETYVLDYPEATEFVPPIEGFFEEVASTVGRVGRRTFRYQPNGGYGLRIRNRGAGKNLLHLGADVGWYRVGDPVVAVADGVVRVAQQPENNDKRQKQKKPADVMEWGGVVAVEHRLADDRYVTTIYGHLDPNLLVSRGDIVQANQPLGTIGATRANGGYTPHLHFGVRDGRMAESGRVLAQININGQPVELKILEATEDTLRLSGADESPDRVNIFIHDQKFELRHSNGNFEVSADILNHLQPPEFAMVGYGLSTDGWRDPVAFLQEPRE